MHNKDKLRRSNKAITSSNKAVIVFHYGETTSICIILYSLAHGLVPACQPLTGSNKAYYAYSGDHTQTQATRKCLHVHLCIGVRQ